MIMEKKFIKHIGKKGFTLLEVMVAISIFSILVVVASGIFSGFIRNYKSTKEIQRNLENAQYAMNIVSKVLRTSTIVSASGSNQTAITVFDNSQGKCFVYRFDNVTVPNNLEVSEKAGVLADCAVGAGYSSFQSVTGDPIDAKGYFVWTYKTSNAPQVGMVTIKMDIGDQSGGKDLAHIQTTVSLRDYASMN